MKVGDLVGAYWMTIGPGDKDWFYGICSNHCNNNCRYYIHSKNCCHYKSIKRI